MVPDERWRGDRLARASPEEPGGSAGRHRGHCGRSTSVRAREATRRLPARTANLRIDYAALSFVAPEKIRFSYLMEGFDNDWVDAGTRRQAFYTNLPPGDYRFRVRASNDGVSSEREAVWAFTLAPAFYQTRWFAAAMVVLALTVARSRGVRACTRCGAVLGHPGRTHARRARGARHAAPEPARRDVPAGRGRQRDRRLERVRQGSSSCDCVTRSSSTCARRAIRSATCGHRSCSPEAWRPRCEAIGGTLTGERARGLSAGRGRHSAWRPAAHRRASAAHRTGSHDERHAPRQRRRCGVELRYRPDSVTLRVRDNGKGFDTGLAALPTVCTGACGLCESARSRLAERCESRVRMGRELWSKWWCRFRHRTSYDGGRQETRLGPARAGRETVVRSTAGWRRAPARLSSPAG